MDSKQHKTFQLFFLNHVVQKTILEEGCSINHPIFGSLCQVVFKTSNFEKPSLYLNSVKEITEVKIGEGDTNIDRNIDICIFTMKLNETSFFVAEHFSVTITLKSYSFCKPPYYMNLEEKCELANHHKLIGMKLYASKHVKDAFYRFSKALKLLLSINEKGNKYVNTLIATLYNNLAQCHMLFGHYEEAIRLTTKSLNIDENNVKSLYRMGYAFTEIQEYEKAVEYLEKANKLDINNHAIKNKMFDLKKRMKKLDKYYAQQMSKLFS